MSDDRVRVMIASPLEPEHVESIRRVDPRIEVLHEPALLPPVRYIADHDGDPAFQRTSAQDARWQELAASADVAFDFPYPDRPPRE